MSYEVLKEKKDLQKRYLCLSHVIRFGKFISFTYVRFLIAYGFRKQIFKMKPLG